MPPEWVLLLRFPSPETVLKIYKQKCSKTKIYTWNGSQMNTYIWKPIKCKQTADCKQIAVCNNFSFSRNFVIELLSEFTEENIPKYKFTLEMVRKYKFTHENLWNSNTQLDYKQTVCLGAIFNNYSKNFNCFWWMWKDGNWINSR